MVNLNDQPQIQIWNSFEVSKLKFWLNLKKKTIIYQHDNWNTTWKAPPQTLMGEEKVNIPLI